MRYAIGLLSICLVTGCSGSLPKPPTFKGEYRPINKQATAPIQTNNQQRVPGIFDFNFEGDVIDSLFALQKIQPQLKVMPPLGQASPFPVRISLRSVSVEEVLQAIAGQGRNVFDVFYAKSTHQVGNQVFICFRSSVKQSSEPIGTASVTPSQSPKCVN